MTVKTCPRCESEWGPKSTSYKRSGWCPPCGLAKDRDYYAKNKERIRARQNASTRNPNGYLKRTYGITKDQYDAMLVEQNGGCAICGGPCPTGKRLAVDHDHVSGAVRGLLCARCNTGIAVFLDNPDLMLAGIEYLRKAKDD